MTRTQKILVSLPPKLIEQMDSLVEQGFYSNRSVLIEQAVRNLITEELQIVQKVKERLEKEGIVEAIRQRLEQKGKP